MIFINNVIGSSYTFFIDATFIKNFIVEYFMRYSIFNKFNSLKLLSVAPTRFASTIVIVKRFRKFKNDSKIWLLVMNGFLTKKIMWIMHNL